MAKQALPKEKTSAERGRTLIPALESLYEWADRQMKEE